MYLPQWVVKFEYVSMYTNSSMSRQQMMSSAMVNGSEGKLWAVIITVGRMGLGIANLKRVSKYIRSDFRLT